MTHLGNMVRYDVAEWISQLLDQRIEPDELVDSIEDGILLAKLANRLLEKRDLGGDGHGEGAASLKVYRVEKGHPKARENVMQFLAACTEEFGVPANRLFEIDELLDRSDDVGVIQALYELGRVQQVVGPPRSIQIGAAFDAGTLADPAPEENTLLRTSVAAVLADLGYNYEVFPINQVHGSWQFTFGQVGPVPIYFIHGDVIARFEAQWITVARFLRQHALLGQGLQPPETPASQQQQSFAAVSAHQASYMDPFQTRSFMGPTPTRSPATTASRTVDIDLRDLSYGGGLQSTPGSVDSGRLSATQHSATMMSPQPSPHRSPQRPQPASFMKPDGGGGVVEVLELRRKLDGAYRRIRDSKDENTQLKVQMSRTREAALEMKQRESQMAADILKGSAVLEQTRTKLAEATSDGYEEKFQQQLHATHDEHREVAEKREAVLHSRLQEHQYFSDLKDSEREAQYKALLEAEVEAALKRRQAEHQNELAAQRADEIARHGKLAEKMEAGYAAKHGKMALTIQQLRKQLRGSGGDTVPGVSHSSHHISSQINVRIDEVRPNPDNLSREEHATSVQDLNKKLRAAKGETKTALVFAAQDKENLVLDHDAAVDSLDKAVHDLREQLQAANAAGRKDLLELQNGLRMEYAVKVAGLEAQLADKTTGRNSAAAAVAAAAAEAKAAAAASDTLTLSALRDAQERAGELSAENSRLELLLKQQAAEHARNDHDELEKLKAANDKALRDLAYEHAENQAELEQDKLQVKLEMLDVREQSSKALASQKLASDEAQRKLKADALNEQRRLLEELTAEHEAALAERKGVHAGAVEAADAVNRAAIEELRGRISEQLLASHDARSVLTNLQSQLKVEKLARSDLEAKLAAESESAHQRLQAREEAQRTLARLQKDLADAQEQLPRDAKAAADARSALQADHQQAQRELRQGHRDNLKAAQDERARSLADRDAVHSAEMDHITEKLRLHEAIKDRELQDRQNDIDSLNRANNKATQAAAKVAKDELAALRAKLTADGDGRVSMLQAALDKANAEIGELKGKVARLLERIAELEALLATEHDLHGVLKDELEAAKATLDQQSANATQEKAAQAARIAELELAADDLRVERDNALAQMHENTERQKAALQAAKDEAEAMRAVAESKEREALAAVKARQEEEMLREAAESLARQNEIAARDALRAAEDAEKTAWDKMQQQQADAELKILQDREAAEALAAEETAWRNSQAELNRLAGLKEVDQLAPFREDICKWMNGMLHPEPRLQPETLLRDLSSGTRLLELTAVIDTQEVHTRERELLAAKAGWGDKKVAKLAASPTTSRKTSKLKATLSPKRPVSKPATKVTVERGKTKAPKGVGAKAGYRPDDAHSDEALADLIRTRPIIKLHVHCKAARGSPEARGNVHEFMRWARGLGLEQPDIFDEDDLLLYKSERHVLFGLYDVARRCRDKVPDYVVFERAHYNPRHRNNLTKEDPVDVAVDEVLRECVCNPRVELTKMAHESYMLSGLDVHDKPVCLQVRGTQVVIRVGGGWDSFKNHLKVHDKCRKNVPLQKAHQLFFKLQEELKTNKKFTKGGQAHIALFTNRLAKTIEARTPKKKKKNQEPADVTDDGRTGLLIAIDSADTADAADAAGC